jgi:hypothetical protein
MTIVEIQQRIRASLEFWHGSHSAHGVASDVELHSSKPLSRRYKSALERLIAAGEVEEYVDPGQEYGYVFTISPDGKVTDTTPRNYSALRLIGEAAQRAEERNKFRFRLGVQEAIPVPYLYVDSDALALAARSSIMTPPTSDSGWWEIQRSWEKEEIPVAEILEDKWQGPITLPIRVTRTDYIEPAEVTESADRDAELVEIRRVGGRYPVDFDYAIEEKSIVLVARLPDEAVGSSPFHGIYVTSFVLTVPFDPYEGSTQAVPSMEVPAEVREAIQEARMRNVEGSNGAENSEEGYEEETEDTVTEDADPWVFIAQLAKDQTAEDFALMALERAGIACGMWSNRGYSVEVRASQADDAIQVLREDADRYGYEVRF